MHREDRVVRYNPAQGRKNSNWGRVRFDYLGRMIYPQAPNGVEYVLADTMGAELDITVAVDNTAMIVDVEEELMAKLGRLWGH